MNKQKLLISGIILIMTLTMYNIIEVQGGLTQELLNYSFESGSGTNADYWSGDEVRIDTVSKTGYYSMQLSAADDYIYQLISIDTDEIALINAYYLKGTEEEVGGITIVIYYSTGGSDSYPCSTTSASWTYCYYDGQIDSNKYLSEIRIVGDRDFTKVDDVKLYTGVIK